MKNNKEHKEPKEVQEDINTLYPENSKLNGILICKVNIYLKGKGFKNGDEVSLKDFTDALTNLHIAKYEPELKEYRPILLKRIEKLKENNLLVEIR